MTAGLAFSLARAGVAAGRGFGGYAMSGQTAVRGRSDADPRPLETLETLEMKAGNPMVSE